LTGTWLVAPLLGGERLWAPVVDDQQAGAFQRREHPRQPALTTRDREFAEQSGRAAIEHGEALAAGFVAQRASQPRLADPCWPADHQVLAVPDPVAAGERVEQSAIEAAWRTEIGVLHHGALARTRLAEPSAETLVVARGDLAFEQQTEPVVAR
jgi:hypothetical protein